LTLLHVRLVWLCVCSVCGDQRDLHSFPTRRSSDLGDLAGGGGVALGSLVLPLQVVANGVTGFFQRGTDAITHRVQCRAGRSRLRSEEHTSELQSRENLVCRLLLEKKKKKQKANTVT